MLHAYCMSLGVQSQASSFFPTLPNCADPLSDVDPPTALRVALLLDQNCDQNYMCTWVLDCVLAVLVVVEEERQKGWDGVAEKMHAGRWGATRRGEGREQSAPSTLWPLCGIAHFVLPYCVRLASAQPHVQNNHPPKPYGHQYAYSMHMEARWQHLIWRHRQFWA